MVVWDGGRVMVVWANVGWVWEMWVGVYGCFGVGRGDVGVVYTDVLEEFGA